MLSAVSNQPSNLCWPHVSRLALTGPVCRPPSPTSPTSCILTGSGASLARSLSVQLSSSPLSCLSRCQIPGFLPLHFPPLSITSRALLSQMLGGQDWPFAGPSLRHHGGGAWARCLLAYSYRLHHKSEEGMQQPTRRRIQVDD